MAATTKSIRVNQSVRWNWEGANTPPNKNVSEFSKTNNFTTGTGAGKVNRLYEKTHTMAGSATVTLDLTSGLTDPEGTAIDFDKVRVIQVENSTLTTSTAVTVGGGSSPTLTNASNPIANGGCLTVTNPTLAGIPVGSSTKNLLIVNNDASNTATVKVVIGGET